MNPHQSLVHGLGHIAYAVAMADGEVQERERHNLEYIIKRGTRELGFDIAAMEMTFLLLDRDELDMETSYTWGMEEITRGRSLLTEEMKEKFVGMMKEVGAAHPPITGAERKIIDRFAAALKEL